MEKNLHSMIAKALKDKNFKKKLMNNPKETIEKELGVHFGDNVNIQILEESESERYLILPAHSGELSAEELEMIAAGQSISWAELRKQDKMPWTSLKPPPQL